MQVIMLPMQRMLKITVVILLAGSMFHPHTTQAAINARGNPNCTLTSRTCVSSGWRFISYGWQYRSCWRWRNSYHCYGKFVDTCQPYINRGCGQISSICSRNVNGIGCQTYTRSYRCLQSKGGTFNDCSPWVNKGCRHISGQTCNTAWCVTIRNTGGTAMQHTYQCLDMKGTSFNHCTSLINKGCTRTSSTIVSTQAGGGQTTNNIYQCLDKASFIFDKCKSLIAKGCKPLSKTCIFRKPNGTCGTYDNSYTCLSKKGTSTTQKICKSAMCINGSCFKMNSPPANDFAPVVAKFAAVTSAAHSLSTSGGVSIFKGNPQHCNKTIFGLKNCCKGSPPKSCPKSALTLDLSRKARKGVFIGTFCANKAFFGSCLRKQEVWCVFPSKLARIVHQQGRAQLGIGWGVPKAPNCRGLTAVELQKIDFSKINFSEIYADIMSKMTPMKAGVLGGRVSTRISNYFNRGVAKGGKVGP